jgi:hypothetical protein
MILAVVRRCLYGLAAPEGVVGRPLAVTLLAGFLGTPEADNSFFTLLSAFSFPRV